MRWWLLLLLAAAVVAKKKHRHQKPGRALLDRLSSSTVGEVLLPNEATGLLPAPLDVAPYASVSANATCGDAGAEEYCRDTPGKRGVVCDVCSGLDGPPSRRHPPSHAVDGDPSTWWQSPSLAAGDYAHVDFEATLPDKMELLHVIIKSGPSPRPLAWSLEVSPSESSDDWRLVRAFGDREHCRRLWDLRPERRRRKARGAKRFNRADKPACSTQFVSQKPLENGEMHVGLGEGVTARRVRISFRGAHASPARHQYYTVRALTLAARCLCHGRAETCDVTTEAARCECQPGSCGAHCQRTACGEECLCGGRGACAYDDSGAILCVNCTENRAGPLCDRCLTGFYNALPDGPCLPCNCDPEGSDGTCKWDKRHHRVSCSCLPGFSGALCDACEEPGAVFPGCQAPTTPACKCDPRGIVDPSRVCDEVCECKANVVGESCDACAPGHFGLSAHLPAGCSPCYCSHITESCAVAPEGVWDPPRDIILPMGEAWLVTDSMGNETVEPSIDDQGKPFLISYEVEGWELFYWVTQAWSGEQLASYGGEVRATMFWGVVRGDTGGNPTIGPDVILIGADGTKLAHANTSHEQPGQVEISAPLLEGTWYPLGEEATEPVTRTELMDVLRDLKAIMLRAHFHFDQDEVRLEAAEIHSANPSWPVAREACACPGGYAGAWCARCAWDHLRVPHARGATPGFECVPCACNGHATCTTVDGPCGECQHNTTGPHCERCLPGHYGNPVQGACKPCACPLYLPSNNFSPNCALASAEGDEFVCTQCPDGYTGDHCEHCDYGYWGSPTTPGSSCKPCDCGGSPCHPDTGLCLTCPPHTEGARCDQCEEGYWFGAGGAGAGAACEACACGAGALAAACDAREGSCACREGWAGRACDICAEGHGGVATGCAFCRCGTAALNNACDALTGECACAPGAAPPACDACLPDHYGLDVTGCLGCNCSQLGAESNACDIRTGQCRCKSHVTGRACDTCEEGYWGLQQGGCRRCECGAGAAACDPNTGLCACAAGVGGAQCDKCLPGFYGFGPAGCLPCPKCTDGKVCSPDSGRCVCPPRSRGPGCKQCAPGYFSRPPGCQACKCGAGAVSNQCDPQPGQCKCKLGWVGPECDVCAPGHFGPRCRPCLCNTAGTKGCEDGVCPCDDDGRCPCKENVIGDKCDQCLQGTFGLSADSPSGCTACFCFGRATYCTQATLTRAAVHAATPHHVTLLRGDKNVPIDPDTPFSIHTHNPDSTIALPQPPVPVYIELDRRFLGDRVTSYGGALRFTVEEEGGEELPVDTMALFPLVRIEGNGIILNHYQRIPARNGTYAVRLHESLWEVRGAGALATRPALMASLQHVERILLRVTTRAPTYLDHVHALLLNVSLDTAIPGLSRSEPALGVELCACSARYSAPSCQEPAIGFWMPPPRVHVTNVAGTIVINVEGDAKPCQCNGRATACDPKTGDCLNCTGGTGGPQCAVCAEGYFGSPEAGCQACPCPSRARNFASACALTGGRLQCLCKPGYTGPECEWCAAGFHRAAGGGGCAPCACDPHGALSPHCDTHGRCRCRPHAAGDKCDRCVAPRAYMDDRGVCTACDNCTQTLLDSVESLSSELRARADLTELSRIPKPFPALLEFAHNTSRLRTSLDQLAGDMETTSSLGPSVRTLEEREHRIFTDANRFRTEASRREEQSHYLSLESMSGLEEVLKQRRRIGETVGVLDDFARGEKHLSAHRALKEAKHLLRDIKDIKLMDFLGGATDVFDSATLQSTAVQEYDYRIKGVQKRVRKLQAALEEWERKSEDLPRLGDVVWAAGDAVAAAEKRVRPKLAAIRDTALRCNLLLEDITSLSANNLTDDISSSLLQAQTLAIKFPSLLSELANLTRAAEEKEGILYNLTPKYTAKYLRPVERHVAELSEKAKHYKSVFSGARSAASLGVSAAHAWGGVASAVRDARDAADTAQATAAAAANTFSRDSVPKAAHAGILASNELKKRGAELLARSDELRNRLEGLRRAADVVSVSLRALGWSERALGERPRARVADTLKDVGVKADRVFATTRAVYNEAEDLRRIVRYNLMREIFVQQYGGPQLGEAQELVSEISSNTLRGSELASALDAAAAARARDHAAGARLLDPALRALRDKIARAKHAAQSISVSLTSSPGGGTGCARAYALDAASPALTRLAIAVSFDNHVRDGPLLHLVDDSDEKEKFIKLVVEKNRLRLSWDLGSGEAVIIHPELLQAAHDDVDQTSYRIEIERIWNTVHLRLERMGGGTPVSVTNSSSSAAVHLAGSRLWLGGRGGDGGLPGCVHALYADDASVGLWNFQQQPPHAQCSGCTQRWYASGSRNGMPTLVWFNGAGYAELRRSGLRVADRRQFSVALTFRTRDENALLFMALDAANNRSVSVVLRDCRVVFLVQYSGARLVIAAGGRHCDGRPAHVHAIRLFANNKLEKGSLRVNGEETLGSASPPVQSAAALPDLSAARYWVGGVPPGAATDLQDAGSVPPALMGCIGALTVDREGYNLLETPTRFGVEPTCDNRVLRSAVLEGDGYIELPSPLFRRKAALGLTFRARAPDGLLLYRAPTIDADGEDEPDADDKHYLALMLVAGELQVLAAAGKAVLRLHTNDTKLDDGLLHSVRLVRLHKQLELWVDEARVANGSLAGNAYPARTRGLFLGGVGDANVSLPGLVATGFTGTVADLIVDAQLVGLETASSWKSARLGRADSEPRADHKTEPRALQQQPDLAACTKTASYTVEAGAVKFGDARWSHAAIKLPPAKELVVSLQFRTFRSKGLLLFAPGARARKKHYVALLISDGRLVLVVRGRKRKKILHSFSYGKWETVEVKVSRLKLSLTVGGESKSIRAGAAARLQRLYVGGLHAPPHPHTIPASIVKLGGFVGCVRRVSVNGRGEDLVRDARSHHQVGQCFPNVEQGAFFAGDGYATWSDAWSFEDGTEIKLQFRSDEASGVLLATRGLLLELKDGAVVATRYSWAGDIRWRLEARGAGGRALCDARWHAVRLTAAALAVDARAVHADTLHGDAPDHAPAAPQPLYIGGLPEGVTEWGDGHEGREGFKGCVRGVSAGGVTRDWRDMTALHSVLLDSCPTHQ